MHNVVIMKRLLIAVSLFAHIICGYGRESELPDSSFIWTIRSIGWGHCNGVSTYKISSDTLIGGKVYKKIFTTSDSIFSESDNSYYCSARDSAGLWFFVPGGDSIEYLLYNYSASIGDTIGINNPWSVGEINALVISKDSVLVEDVYKTRLGIGARQGELWEYWIEDIGCISGLFYSCYFIFDKGYELTCTYFQDEFYYNFGYDGLCGCYPRTSIESSKQALLPSIYPNPCNGVINIKNPLQTQLKFRLFSMEGKLIDQFVLGGYESKILEIDYKGNIGIRIEGNEIRTTRIIQMIK